MYTAKAALVASVLKNLGYELPESDEMRKAIVAAVREYKRQQGLSMDPDVALTLVPLPGIRYGENEQAN